MRNTRVRVVFCSILYISLFCIIFFVLIILRLSVLPEFAFAFHSPSLSFASVFYSIPVHFFFHLNGGTFDRVHRAARHR